MGRDIVLDIIAHDDVSKTLARTSASFDALAEDLDHVSKRSGQFSSEAAKMRVTVEHVDNVIAKTRQNVKELSAEFARTGDVDIFRKMKDGERVLRDLERIKKSLGDLPDSPKGFFKSFNEGLGALGPQIGTIVRTALVAAAVSSIPMMSAAVSAAFVGGLGTAGLAAGIAAAARSTEVINAFQDLSDEATSQFGRIGEYFKRPVTDAIGILTKGFKSLDLASMVAPLAESVKPLATGIVSAIQEAMPGITRAIAAAGPIFDMVASRLPDIGAAVGSFAKHMADAAPAAKEVLGDLITITSELIRASGWVVEFFAKLYHGAKEYTPVGLALRGILALGDGEGDERVSVTNKLSSANDRLAAAARNAGEQFQAAREKLDAYYTAQRGSFDASVELEQSIDDLGKSINENGRTLDIATQKGRDNVQNIERMIDAAVRQGQETENAAKAQGREATAYSEGMAARNAAIEQVFNAARAYGYTTNQIQDLTNKILGLPVGTRTLDYKVNITANVYGNKGALDAVLNPGSVTAAQLNNANRLLDKGRASGGPVLAGEAYIVGEHRPEVFIPDRSGVILPSVPSRASGGAAMGGGGITVLVQAGLVATADEVRARIVAALREWVITNGPLNELVTT